MIALKHCSGLILEAEHTQRLAAAPQVQDKYNIFVCDDSIDNPFVISKELLLRMNALINRSDSNSLRAKKLYDYLHSRIYYGANKRVLGYSSGLEVWKNKEGVCGEMTFLYVTLARYCGLDAMYVQVNKDCNGNSVVHGCAGVFLDRLVLVDIAYHTFDIHHMQYLPLIDNEILTKYKQWRNRF